MAQASRIVVAACFFILLPKLVSADTTVSIQASPASVSVGDTFTVNVNITDVTDLLGFGFDLNFDPTILSAQSVNEGAFLPSGGTTFFIAGSIDNVGGSIANNGDSLVGPIPGVSGSGTLLTCQFLAIGAGTGDLSLTNTLLLDSNLEGIPATLEDGTVTVAAEENGGGGPTPAPEPSGVSVLSTGLLCVFLLANRRPRKADKPLHS